MVLSLNPLIKKTLNRGLRWPCFWLLLFPLSVMAMEPSPPPSSGGDHLKGKVDVDMEPNSPPSSSHPFLEGLQAYKEQNFQKAQEHFTKLVEEYPKNPVILYNLGLAEYQLGRFGMALGLWRKARSIDKGLKPVQKAIAFTEEQLFPAPTHSSFLTPILKGLRAFPLWAWLSLCLTSFFGAFFFLIDYGLKRRLPPNLWPSWIFLLFPVWLFSTVLSLSLFMEKQQPMGTVTLKKLPTHANPTETSPTLSELEEGQKVFIKKTHGEWLQVQSPSGPPGWVPQGAIIPFKGSIL